MKKYLAIFAHYDKDEIIDDYVILYLQDLKKVAQDIIFVSDGNLSATELKKLEGICHSAIAQKHGEYDFGSWKRGLAEMDRLNMANHDSLILANDSCYLISSLVPIFQEMEKRKPVDFWGIAQSKQYGVEHIHSYFMVFERRVFESKVFRDFFANVRSEEKKIEIIKKYENGLTKSMIKSGFSNGSFVEKTISSLDIGNKNLFAHLIPAGYPFLKINLFDRGFSIIGCKSYIDAKTYKVFCNNLIRRIGGDVLLEAYSLSYFYKVFLHKKIFVISLKQKKLSVKIFGITILKIKIGNER